MIKNKILIGTPCYNFSVFGNYMQCVVDFIKGGYDVTPFLYHDSLITRSRNDILTHFYERKEFTHLLWLDADVSIPIEGLKSLLSHHVDVVGAPIPIKKQNSNACAVKDVYEELTPYLCKAKAAATGALLMSRKSIEALVKLSDWYYDEERSERKIFNVFGVGIREKEYMSEDWYICYKLRELGFEIYVDSSFPVTHMGVTDFSRSLSSHFKKFDYS